MLVVADAHLGQVPPAAVAAFHRFLDAVPDLGDALLINGDLFDFWFEYRSVIPRRHFGTMAKLQSVRARDVAVTLVGGNHDRWGGDFLTKDLGIAFYAGEAEIDVAGRRAFVAHGDGLTEQHWSARVMHRVTRHAVTIRLFRALHPDVGFWIAHQLSRKLADNTRDRAVLDRAERAQARYAEELLARRPDLQLVILAHTHRTALAELPNGRAYLNPGVPRRRQVRRGDERRRSTKDVSLRRVAKAYHKDGAPRRRQPSGTTSTICSFSPRNRAPTLRKCGSSSETTKR